MSFVSVKLLNIYLAKTSIFFGRNVHHSFSGRNGSWPKRPVTLSRGQPIQLVCDCEVDYLHELIETATNRSAWRAKVASTSTISLVHRLPLFWHFLFRISDREHHSTTHAQLRSLQAPAAARWRKKYAK